MHRTGMTMCVAAVIASLGASSSAAAQSALLDRLQIHGYLSQGYATSSELPLFGIPTDGSTDYRNAALQFRYALSDADFAVIQLKHRRLGGSVLTADGNDVELGWAFYQRRFGAASIRLGRIPLPGGIFNETRDVGTLLPFYRAPGNFYIEGIESIDGVVGSFDLPLGRWSLETHLGYGGLGFEIPIVTPAGPALLADRVESFTTGQLWLNTPVPGVRIGANGARWRGESTAGETTQGLWIVSVDASLDRGFARGEYREVDFTDFRINTYYAQAGLRFGPFSLNGQADFSDVQIPVSPIGPLQFQAARDLALGVNFVHTPNLVYKLEAHRSRGSNFDVYLDPLAGQGRTNYFIGSVSVSF
jgi:hypothetical protein